MIVGDLDLFAGPRLGEAIAPLLSPSDVPSHVEIDLGGVAFCDTSGLDALHAAVTAFEKAGAQVIAVGTGRQLRTLLASAAAGDWHLAAPLLAAATAT